MIAVAEAWMCARCSFRRSRRHRARIAPPTAAWELVKEKLRHGLLSYCIFTDAGDGAVTMEAHDCDRPVCPPVRSLCLGLRMVAAQHARCGKENHMQEVAGLLPVLVPQAVHRREGLCIRLVQAHGAPCGNEANYGRYAGLGVGRSGAMRSSRGSPGWCSGCTDAWSGAGKNQEQSESIRRARGTEVC